ncbi:MAG: wax ester/triacylglycerol synthase domain-containing protein, partial [Rubrivivax sp.]
GFKGNFADKLHAKLLKRPPGAPFNYRLNLALGSLPSVEPMPDVDLEAHVHRLSLNDASEKELLKKVCSLHESLLDRSGLLWQFYVIDGLADGRVALYGKVHHGIIDGKTFVKAMTQWMSDDPKDKDVRAMWDGVARPGARDPQRLGLVQRLMAASGQATGALQTAAGLYAMLAEQGLRSAGLGDGLPLPYLKVSSDFDGPLSAKRSYAYCSLPLAEIRAIGKAQGATVNDLLLTVLDMALHRHLGKQRASPQSPLLADMPVALSSGAKGGNQIAVLQVPLGGADASPAERLAAIRAETGRVKASMKKRSSGALMLYSTLVHALPLLIERVSTKAAPRIANLMVSNPFGFEGRQYLMGAAVELALPLSVLAAGYKLNVTAVTVGDRLQIGFLAMPKAVPDIDKLARATERAFDEMKAALGPVVPARAANSQPAPATGRRPRAKQAHSTKPAGPRKVAADTTAVSRRSIAGAPRVARKPAKD